MISHLDTEADTIENVVTVNEIKALEQVADPVAVPEEASVESVAFEAKHFSTYTVTFSNNGSTTSVRFEFKDTDNGDVGSGSYSLWNVFTDNKEYTTEELANDVNTYIAGVCAELPKTKEKFLKQKFLKNIPCPMTQEEFVDYATYSLDGVNDKLVSLVAYGNIFEIVDALEKQEHEHSDGCGCGHEHHHEHGHDCSCGHEHHHEHGHDCGCGHEHHHEHGHDCGCGHHHH